MRRSRSSRRPGPSRASGVHRDILRVRRVALWLGEGDLSLPNLALAVLSLPGTRALAVRVTPYTDGQLRDPTPLPRILPPDVPEAPWPPALLEYEKAQTPEDKQDHVRWLLSSPENFVLWLWRVTPSYFFYRESVGSSFGETRAKVRAAVEEASSLLPAQAAAIRDFGSQLLERVCLSQSGKHAEAGPLFVFAPHGQGVSTLVRTFAERLGCVYAAVNGGSTGASELIHAIDDQPPALIEVDGFRPSLPAGSALRSLLNYYVDQRASIEEFADVEAARPSHGAGKFESLMRRCWTVFHMVPPVSGVTMGSYSPQELAVLIQNEYGGRAEDNPAYYQPIEAKYWSLIRPDNSVVLRHTRADHLVRQVVREIADTTARIRAEDLGSPLSVQSPEVLAALLILSNGSPCPKGLVGVARRFLLDCAWEVPARAGSFKVVVDGAGSDVPGLLTAREAGTARWYEELERLARRLNFSSQRLQYTKRVDRKRRKVVVENIQPRTPMVAAGENYLKPRPALRFADVAGMEAGKEVLSRIVRYFKDPSSFRRLDVTPPLRILLYGPPGTGKTRLVQAFAGETGLPFLAVSGAELTTRKWSGESARRLRALFETAAACTPCILFIDELDAFGNRENLGQGETAYDAKCTLTQFLTLVDGLDTIPDILLIGATNRVEDLDPALLRPGRFGTQVAVRPLSAKEREGLIRRHISPAVCGRAYDPIVRYLVTRTTGAFTGAEIVHIITEAKLVAEEAKRTALDMPSVAKAADAVILGKKLRELGPEVRRATAIHEAGHALLFRLLLPRRRLQRVSLGWREDNLGIVMPAEDEDEANWLDRDQHLLSMLAWLGGTAAEEVVLGHWNLGGGQDFDHAVLMAERAAADLGIGAGFAGIVESRLARLNQKARTEELEREIGALVARAHGVARALLGEHKPALLRLADKLEELEDLDHEAVDAIVGDEPRPDSSAIIAQLISTGRAGD